VNRFAAAIKFYYFKVLERNWRTSLIPRRKEKKTVPMVLTKEEISKMIHCLRNVKHRAMLMTLYGTGMRNDELRNLKAEDIDSKRMVIHIRNGKGNRDREAILSPKLLEYLRYYWKTNKDDKSNYLFTASKDPNKPGEKPNKKLSHTAVGAMVKTAARIAGIKKKSTLTP
jgi:integrase